MQVKNSKETIVSPGDIVYDLEIFNLSGLVNKLKGEMITMLKMGYEEVDITPVGPAETVGFGREDNMSRGISKPLLAQVSLWEECKQGCLITIDSLGFTKKLTDKLRERVANVLGIFKDKVMICFSHCHSAPNADVETEYYQIVCKKIETAALVAGQKLRAMNVGWGNACVDIGVNRRRGTEPLDKRAGVLKVCSVENGAMELLLLRVTAHCNVLKADNYMISPDYFGEIRDKLKEKYHCPVMVVQGSAGNIAPKYFQSELTPVDAIGDLYISSQRGQEDMALEVLTQVAPVIAQIKAEKEPTLSIYSKNLLLSAKLPNLETAEGIVADAKKYCGIDGQGWLNEVKGLLRCGVTHQEESVEVQYFQIGSWCLCGVPYELMEEFAVGAMNQLKNEFIYLNGYTNGCLTYFPMEEEFDRGGYEVYWSLLIYYSYFNRVFPFEREEATKLLEFVTQL